jgi:DNA-directed RNA polymerase specialized sigma24 family protein
MTIDTPGVPDRDDGPPQPPRSVLDASYTGFDRRHRAGIRDFLRLLEADHGLVEDVLQEALLATREKWAYVRTYEKPEAWTLRTARNILSDQRTRRRRHGVTALDEHPPAEYPAVSDAREAQDLVGIWLRQMPRGPAEVIALSIDGWSDREIARILQYADSTVREYKAAARKRMETLATEAGYVVPAGRRRRR